jgi:hypothetical protein
MNIPIYGVWSEQLPYETFLAKKGTTVFLELEDAFRSMAARKHGGRAVYVSSAAVGDLYFVSLSARCGNKKPILRRGVRNWKPVSPEALSELVDVFRALAVEENLGRELFVFNEEGRVKLGQAMGQQIRDTMNQQSQLRRIFHVDPIVDAAVKLHASTPLSKKV